MDWSTWSPRQLATLCFIRKNRQVLLIHKKRGLGAGKVNAPGGKLEPGESAMAAAVRETQEEVGLTPLNLEKRAELSFQFTDGYSLHCTVFLATDCTGEMVETAEATPFWVDESAIPFDRMWEDDKHWLPQMLAGKSLHGFFHFDGETMLSKDVRF